MRMIRQDAVKSHIYVFVLGQWRVFFTTPCGFGGKMQKPADKELSIDSEAQTNHQVTSPTSRTHTCMRTDSTSPAKLHKHISDMTPYRKQTNSTPANSPTTPAQAGPYQTTRAWAASTEQPSSTLKPWTIGTGCGT